MIPNLPFLIMDSLKISAVTLRRISRARIIKSRSSSSSSSSSLSLVWVWKRVCKGGREVWTSGSEGDWT